MPAGELPTNELAIVMRAVQITEFGGPEVLSIADVDEPDVPAGASLLTVNAAGVNYADTHAVENTYLRKVQLPYIPGLEVVGTTPEGRRVVGLVAGGYAERAITWPQLSFDVPDDVEDSAALAIVLQGTTAWHLLRTSGRLEPGESVLVHAAAGGVGSIAVQLAKAWGAKRVIAAASSETKRGLAMQLGADVAIDSTAADLREAILEANEGRRVDIALEMTGGTVFDATLSALADDGRIVVYGQAGREPATPVAPHTLMFRSQAVVGASLTTLVKRPDRIRIAVEELLRMAAAGELQTVVGRIYALEDARKAHEDLRARATVGKLVLDAKGAVGNAPSEAAETPQPGDR